MECSQETRPGHDFSTHKILSRFENPEEIKKRTTGMVFFDRRWKKTEKNHPEKIG